MSNTSMNIVIIGVGGQGTLLASKILGALAAEKGLDCKVSEVHGMSQRGGSVITYVRIGESVHSPMVGLGEADYVLAFEEIEALRALEYVKANGRVIVNTQKILPMPVIIGKAVYPEDAIARLNRHTHAIALDALAIAKEAGEARSVNLVLLGVLCALLGDDPEPWRNAIRACVPDRFTMVNLMAFDAGRNRISTEG